jgi:hypothetical protein
MVTSEGAESNDRANSTVAEARHGVTARRAGAGRAGERTLFATASSTSAVELDDDRGDSRPDESAERTIGPLPGDSCLWTPSKRAMPQTTIASISVAPIGETRLGETRDREALRGEYGEVFRMTNRPW